MNSDFERSDFYKEYSLDTELRASIRLIEIGLGELQNLNPFDGFYHLPFQLLASGFERLMKCHICYGHHEQEGIFPSFTELKRAGHDLIQLKNTILEKYFQINGIPLLQEDYNYLHDDANINRLIDILSEFGKAARYYNLDIVTESIRPTRNVEEEWKQYENEFYLVDPSLLERLNDSEGTKEAKAIVTGKIVVQLERFIGAISRQFTMGRLGRKAQQYSGAVTEFILNNNKLGTRDYRVITSRYKERKSHKRNLMDRFRTRYNSNYKSKQLTKKEYEEAYSGDWPFYADKVVLESRYSRWYIVTIEGWDYALNGNAKGKYKLENPFDGGVVLPGKDFSKIIQITRDLG